MPRWFTPRYTPPGFKYPEPERYTPAIARARRLNSMLERDRRFADIPNFKSRLSALSQASKIDSVKSRRVVDDLESPSHKAALIAAAIAKIHNSELSDPVKAKRYRALRAVQNALRREASMGGRSKLTVPGGDKRRYNPTGKDFAARTSGVVASLVLPSHAWQQVFRNPGSVIPCIQRDIRRQVMFASRTAGIGYRKKKRRTWSSGVPC
jgi:hypothetical protein